VNENLTSRASTSIAVKKRIALSGSAFLILNYFGTDKELIFFKGKRECRLRISRFSLFIFYFVIIKPISQNETFFFPDFC
jgi:hypothetical protein